MEELIKKCTWEWTSLNGVNGYKVIGSNGNSIFLPAASCTHMIPEYGVNGYYWTSTRCPEEYDYDAWGLYFTEEHNLINGWNLPNLFSVRPVSE
ncbi:MAG: hypothetical protein K2I64_05025 [Muribaculaceae bacterium]|nr:hypothetical protein [Muribaculaceae bacterium]